MSGSLTLLSYSVSQQNRCRWCILHSSRHPLTQSWERGSGGRLRGAQQSHREEQQYYWRTYKYTREGLPKASRKPTQTSTYPWLVCCVSETVLYDMNVYSVRCQLSNAKCTGLRISVYESHLNRILTFPVFQFHSNAA